ncbi:MAG: indole-3-glycerol phosphate synthase TrpC [Pirellulaceae bacterium]
MTTLLDRIVATKKTEVAAAQVARPLSELKAVVNDLPPPRDFFSPLAAGGGIKLIAEVKKASPSKGIIRADFDPVRIARTYQQHGASCISVLTDAQYFHGSLDYLRQIRAAVELPLLRKDFVIDAYQVFEARLAGADAVLLIAECLDDCQLRKLHNEIIELGMTPLVEFYEPANMSRVLEAGATLVGVNNRDLRTFVTDLQHTVRMRQRLPDDCVVVGESGIHSRDDALLLQQAGVSAMLVGEHLMSQDDIGAAVDRLLEN